MEGSLFAQQKVKEIRKGNEFYQKGQFEEAENEYRASLERNNFNFDKASFNLGTTLYQKEDFENAIGEFERLSKMSEQKEVQENAFYNLGNSYLKAGKLKESIEAYKGALRLNPNAENARYNMEYAKKLLKEQEKNQDQNKDQDNKDQNQDKQDNKDKQENQDQENKDQENKDEKQDQNNDQENKQDKGDKKDDEQQNQQPKEGQMSKQDAQRLLDALNQDEKDVQKKVMQQQTPVKKQKIEKDW